MASASAWPSSAIATVSGASSTPRPRRAFQGRGLATILVAEAVAATRDAGLRIAAPCSMVADYLAKHPEYDGIVDAS